jgi:hypothetical protein
VVIDQRVYSVKRSLAGRKVVLVANARDARFEILLGKEVVKSVAITDVVRLSRGPRKQLFEGKKASAQSCHSD